jgi:hypothetical protein
MQFGIWNGKGWLRTIVSTIQRWDDASEAEKVAVAMREDWPESEWIVHVIGPDEKPYIQEGQVNDLETLKAMLDRAEIEFTTSDEGEFIHPNNPYINKGRRQLQVERGYTDFVTIFGFDESGKLVGMGAWE